MASVHWINYWISKIAKIPSTEQDGGINVMSMMTTTTTSNGEIFKYTNKMGLDDYY